MNELDMRLNGNLLYGDPTRIIAIGTNKNLVQGANPPPQKKERDPIRDLESILEATYGKERLHREFTEKQRKRVAQGSIPRYNHNNICKDKLSILERLLRFSEVLK
jgi:hypothetical protein